MQVSIRAEFKSADQKMKIDTERLFVELARSGSFSAAAKTLGISAAAASKQINQLESRLGMTLVIRNTRGLRLTEAGEAVLESYIAVLEERQKLHSRLQDIDTNMSGRISIVVPTTFSHLFLSPILKSFMAQYPDIYFSVTTSNSSENLIEGPFDLAIRYGFLEDSTLTARKLADLPVTLCCSKTYLEKHRPVHHLRDLKHHKLVLPQSFRDTVTAKQKALGNVDLPDERIAILSSDTTFTLQCLKDDLGVGALPLMLIRDDLKSGQLVQLLPDLPLPVLPLSVVLPAGSAVPKRIRAFVDHLVEQTGDLERS